MGDISQELVAHLLQLILLLNIFQQTVICLFQFRYSALKPL